MRSRKESIKNLLTNGGESGQIRSPSLVSPYNSIPELGRLAELSSRLGADPLLVQAATGNTSLKIGGTVWIKGSGKWLANAGHEDIFVPIDLAEARSRIARRRDPSECTSGASVETAMHVVIPHRVVLHLHSVNTIAWAVKRDAEEQLKEPLAGLRWRWIPYASSGLDLAMEIARAPQAEVFVLGNHGLVVCGSDCHAAERLLREVEARLRIGARMAAAPDDTLLAEAAGHGAWRLPVDCAAHSLATDAVSRRILTGGVLYPCQAIFLQEGDFRIVDDAGVLVREDARSTVDATLSGLAEVLARIPSQEAMRYLSTAEVAAVTHADVYRYRARVESSAPTLGMMRIHSLA